MSNTFSLSAKHLAGGYHSQQRNRAPEELSIPSKNIRYTKTGAAECRKGYDDTDTDLATANYAFTPHYSQRFNISFFAGGGKLLYVDHNNDDTVVDTGITLDSTVTTRMVESRGILFLHNTVDGLKILILTKLNGAVTAGGNITIDLDGAALLNRFSLTSSNICINGTDEAYTNVNVTTGVLTATSSAAYADNTFAFVVKAIPNAPKCSKYVVWRNSLNGIGMAETEADTTYDVPTGTMAGGRFATANSIENIVDFTGTGSTSEPVEGNLTNIIALEGYIILFTKQEAYTIGLSDVNQATGSRPPNFFTNAGCINEECAVEMDGDLVWASPEGRVIRARRAVIGNVPTLDIDSEFDAPIHEHLRNINTTQDNAVMHYWKKGKLLFYQVSIDEEVLTFVWDNDKGAWCPPDTNKIFAKYYERNGDLYATDAYDDTIYRVEFGVNDNGADIPWVIATGIFTSEGGITTVETGIMEFLGDMTQPATVYYVPHVNSKQGNEKEILSSTASFSIGSPIGATTIPFAIGGGGTTEEFGSFSYKTAIVPAYGEEFQHKWYSNGDNHRFRIKNWKQTGQVLEDSTITMK